MTLRRIGIISVAFAGLVCAALCCGAQGQAAPAGPDETIAIGDGMAPLNDDTAAAEEEAVWDAKRNAVEQAAGLFLHSRSLGSNLAIEDDEIKGRTNGFIRQWEIVAGSRHIENVGAARLLHIQVRATVALIPVIRKLSDIKDIYNDLERPRLRVDMEGDGPAGRARNALIANLKAQGFEIADDDSPAEIILKGRLEITPTVQLGDKNSPFAIGDVVATCRARLSAQVVSGASEEILFSAAAEGTGRSFDADSAAAEEATGAAATALLSENQSLFVEHLLVRWTREREEGYVAVIRVDGLNAHRQSLLDSFVEEMRGFRRIVAETREKNQVELHFLTRLDLNSIRRRLDSLTLDSLPLRVVSRRGPLIVCTLGKDNRHVSTFPHGPVRPGSSCHVPVAARLRSP